MTASLKVIVTGITSLSLYVSSETVDVTDATVATTPSMTKALFALREFEAPGDANVKVAALPAASFILPLFSARELVAL